MHTSVIHCKKRAIPNAPMFNLTNHQLIYMRSAATVAATAAAPAVMAGASDVEAGSGQMVLSSPAALVQSMPFAWAVRTASLSSPQ